MQQNIIEVSNATLKSLSDKERLNVCKDKINECLSYLYKSIYIKPCIDILFQSQDKYISIALHLLITTNDYYNFDRLFYNQQIVLYSITCNGLFDYALLTVDFSKNFQMNRKIKMYNLSAMDKFIMKDIIYEVLINCIHHFIKKRDYYQGGFLNYLKESIHNRLYKICNKIDRINKRLNKKIVNKKHRSYLTSEEIEIVNENFNSVYISKEMFNKYHLDELNDRQLNYVRILIFIDTDKRISYKDVAKILNVSEKTIKRDFKRIKEHIKKFI